MTGQNNTNVNKQFDSTYERTNRNVTLFLISKCKNFTDVNDILQDVYMEQKRKYKLQKKEHGHLIGH